MGGLPVFNRIMGILHFPARGRFAGEKNAIRLEDACVHGLEAPQAGDTRRFIIYVLAFLD